MSVEFDHGVALGGGDQAASIKEEASLSPLQHCKQTDAGSDSV